MQPDGSFKQTTMDAMLGRGAEDGMRPIGSIETANGKLATMYTMDGAPGSKAFFDGESWHIQAQGADSFTVTKGSSIPGEYAEITNGFDGAKAPLENLPEAWSRSSADVLKGGSPVGYMGISPAQGGWTFNPNTAAVDSQYRAAFHQMVSDPSAANMKSFLTKGPYATGSGVDAVAYKSFISGLSEPQLQSLVDTFVQTSPGHIYQGCPSCILGADLGVHKR